MVDQLAQEYTNQPVLFLELNADNHSFPGFAHWRLSAGMPYSWTLPMALVDSGYRHSSGSENGQYYTNYKAMVDAALAVPAEADLTASWNVVGGNAVVSVTMTNLSGHALGTSNSAEMHIFAYVESPPETTDPKTHLTSRTVQAEFAIPFTLGVGETMTQPYNITPIANHSWSEVKFFVLADYIPTAGSPYQSLQGAIAVRTSASGGLFLPIVRK